MALKPINRVLPLPARPTEVLEAFEVPAEIGAHHAATHRAEGILEIRVYLDLQGNEDNTLPQLLPDYIDKTFTQHT